MQQAGEYAFCSALELSHFWPELVLTHEGISSIQASTGTVQKFDGQMIMMNIYVIGHSEMAGM